jgi:hypothetical protein
MTPFDFINTILSTKKNLMDDISEKDYAPFIINRGLSYHFDCILYANEMNLNSILDKDMQYQYLLNSVRSMKRKFQPWQKSKTINDLDCIKEYFGYSNNKAKDALRILSEEQLIQIREKTIKGGVNK